MPIRFIRLLVAFALAFAIPLQGLASVTAGVCMALGHHDGSPMPPQAQHDHGEGQAHDHGTAPADEGDSAHCPPCVACCAAASIAPALQLFAPQDSSYTVIAAQPFPAPGALPDKLDRPPLDL